MKKSSLILVAGPEELLAQRAIDGILAAARKQDPTTERRIVDATDVGAIGELGQACSPTLFGGSAVVIVTGLDSAAPEFIDELISFAHAGEFQIVGRHPGGMKGKKQLAALELVAQQVVQCPEIKKLRDTKEFVAGEFRTQNRRITAEGVNLLIAAVGPDVRALAAACAQLASDIESPELAAEDVALYFGGTVDVAGYQIADAVLNRNAAQALRLMRLAEGTDGSGRLGPATVASLVQSVRQLVSVATAPAGMNDRDLAVAAKVPPWKLGTINTQLRRWTQRDLAAAVLLLADLDAATKGGLREGEQLEPVQKGLLLERTVTQLAVTRR